MLLFFSSIVKKCMNKLCVFFGVSFLVKFKFSYYEIMYNKIMEVKNFFFQLVRQLPVRVLNCLKVMFIYSFYLLTIYFVYFTFFYFFFVTDLFVETDFARFYTFFEDNAFTSFGFYSTEDTSRVGYYIDPVAWGWCAEDSYTIKCLTFYRSLFPIRFNYDVGMHLYGVVGVITYILVLFSYNFELLLQLLESTPVTDLDRPGAKNQLDSMHKAILESLLEYGLNWDMWTKLPKSDALHGELINHVSMLRRYENETTWWLKGYEPAYDSYLVTEEDRDYLVYKGLVPEYKLILQGDYPLIAMDVVLISAASMFKGIGVFLEGYNPPQSTIGLKERITLSPLRSPLEVPVLKSLSSGTWKEFYRKYFRTADRDALIHELVRSGMTIHLGELIRNSQMTYNVIKTLNFPESFFNGEGAHAVSKIELAKFDHCRESLRTRATHAVMTAQALNTKLMKDAQWVHPCAFPTQDDEIIWAALANQSAALCQFAAMAQAYEDNPEALSRGTKRLLVQFAKDGYFLKDETFQKFVKRSEGLDIMQPYNINQKRVIFVAIGTNVWDCLSTDLKNPHLDAKIDSLCAKYPNVTLTSEEKKGWKSLENWKRSL